MLRQIPLEQVALNLQTTVDEVNRHHEQLIVTQNGTPVAVLVTYDFYQRMLAARRQAFSYLDNLPTRDLPYSAEEVEADIEQAIREVRKEYKAK
jgi:prevent-host-death family protein